MHTEDTPSPGSLIREWRTRRRMSQLDLALDAEISQRHLSFLESGRSLPSRDMVMRLAERLEVPLRERNRILLAAGHAPGYGERSLDDPALGAAMGAVELVLKGHEPFPAIAVDRHWNMLRANRAVAPFLQGIAEPALLSPPVNVLRLSLHPGGLAPRIVNLAEWREHVLERLGRLNDAVPDPALEALEAELSAYPAPRHAGHRRTARSDIATMLRVRAGDAVLSFVTTITVFGTPLDVTVSELAIESFFPADDGTARFLRRLAEEGWGAGAAERM